MTNFISPLQIKQWSLLSEHNDLPSAHYDWLAESGSMTQRLRQYCSRIHVAVQQEGWISLAQAGDEAQWLPISERYWLREVVLYGDGAAWLFGRTVLAECQISGMVQQLGDQPLGEYLFREGNPKRDFIQIGQQQEGNTRLWARRCCLWLSGQPLLLTELFLPSAPLYSDTDD